MKLLIAALLFTSSLVLAKPKEAPKPAPPPAEDKLTPEDIGQLANAQSEMEKAKLAHEKADIFLQYTILRVRLLHEMKEGETWTTGGKLVRLAAKAPEKKAPAAKP